MNELRKDWKGSRIVIISESALKKQCTNEQKKICSLTLKPIQGIFPEHREKGQQKKMSHETKVIEEE